VIFVTGGTGLLGNNIVRELCSRGVATRVLCRPETPREPFEGLDVEIVAGDLSDPNLLQSAIADCDCVIHSAAFIHIGWQQLEASLQVNLQGTQRIVDMCCSQRTRLIHISTVDTLPAAVRRDCPIDEGGLEGVAKTACSYVISKTQAESVVNDAVKSRELDAVVLHPGFMLGPYDWKPSSGRMFLEVTRAPVVAAPPGGCSVCDARDVAAAVVNSVKAGEAGEHFILAGENLTYQELWTHMLATAERRRKVFRLGAGVRMLGHLIDMANRLVPGREGDVNGASIAMGGLQHFYSSEKARSQLAYTTRPLEVTLADAWQWLKSRH
jgi:dihydroflavonol-4-reductase